MTYVIVNSVDLDQAKVDACIQTSLDTVRKSADGTKAVLKYSGAQPSTLTGATEYTHAQILVEMAKAEWDAGV